MVRTWTATQHCAAPRFRQSQIVARLDLLSCPKGTTSSPQRAQLAVLEGKNRSVHRWYPARYPARYPRKPRRPGVLCQSHNVTSHQSTDRGGGNAEHDMRGGNAGDTRRHHKAGGPVGSRAWAEVADREDAPLPGLELDRGIAPGTAPAWPVDGWLELFAPAEGGGLLIAAGLGAVTAELPPHAGAKPATRRFSRVRGNVRSTSVQRPLIAAQRRPADAAPMGPAWPTRARDAGRSCRPGEKRKHR